MTVLRTPPPGRDEVHLWAANLDPGSTDIGTLSAVCSDQERDAAASHRFHTDRLRRLVSRGWLRHLLGGYLGVEPGDIALCRDSGGKPRVAPGTGDWLRFSVTHTEGIAFYAATDRREVGVDAERICGEQPGDADLWRFFTKGERDGLGRLPRSQRIPAFYRCWTRREAYLKATGAGLAGLDGIDRPGEGWSLYGVPFRADLALTVAVRGSVRQPEAPRALTLAPPEG